MAPDYKDNPRKHGFEISNEFWWALQATEGPGDLVFESMVFAASVAAGFSVRSFIVDNMYSAQPNEYDEGRSMLSVEEYEAFLGAVADPVEFDVLVLRLEKDRHLRANRLNRHSFREEILSLSRRSISRVLVCPLSEGGQGGSVEQTACLGAGVDSDSPPEEPRRIAGDPDSVARDVPPPLEDVSTSPIYSSSGAPDPDLPLRSRPVVDVDDVDTFWDVMGVSPGLAIPVEISFAQELRRLSSGGVPTRSIGHLLIAHGRHSTYRVENASAYLRTMLPVLAGLHVPEPLERFLLAAMRSTLTTAEWVKMGSSSVVSLLTFFTLRGIPDPLYNILVDLKDDLRAVEDPDGLDSMTSDGGPGIRYPHSGIPVDSMLLSVLLELIWVFPSFEAVFTGSAVPVKFEQDSTMVRDSLGDDALVLREQKITLHYQHPMGERESSFATTT